MIPRPRIVIINDDLVQLKTLQGVLDESYVTIPFGDPTAALSAMSESVSADLVIVDLHMPEIDGWRVCRVLRSPAYEAFNKTPILVVSATYSGVDVESITNGLMASAFLPMPVPAERLRTTVEDLLAGRCVCSTESVLIIDRDLDHALPLSESFSRHGFAVWRAESLMKASQLIDEHDPGVIVIDYGLTDGPMSEALGGLHRPADSRVIPVTSDDSSPTVPVGALRAGAAGFIRKPFDSEYVVDLAGKAKRERALLRVEEYLEGRTQELRTSEVRYRSLFETIPDAILSVDEDGRIVHSNPSANRLFGIPSSGASDLTFEELVQPDHRHRVATSLMRIWSSRGGALTATLNGGGGSAIDVDISAQATPFEGGDLMLLLLRDVTRTRAMEREKRLADAEHQHAQKLESLGVLSGGIAHDFNNFLMSIMGNAGLAMDVLGEGHQAIEFVHQIEVVAERAAELTSQILSYSGRGPAILEPLNLNDTVAEIVSLLDSAVSKSAVIKCRLPPAILSVEADGSQLRQVLVNLIMNASDSLEGRPGTITVEAGRDRSTERTVDGGEVPTSGDGSRIWLEVHDTGSGMSEATKARIFDPFFTTKANGRGLGLASVRGIIKSHGGTVSVESKLGVGTRIRVGFPASRRPVDKGPGPGEEPTPERGSGTLLVVDDDPEVRNVVASGLEMRGFRVITAEDGYRGVELFNDHRAEIHATVLDLTMPGLDGAEVLAEIRQADPQAPVVLSSGFMENAAHANLDHDDRTIFLQKPYRTDSLLLALRQLWSADPPHRLPEALKSGV